MKTLLTILALVVLPASALASAAPAFTSGNTVLLSTSTPGNVYAVGGTVSVAVPSKGDLTSVGGSLVIDASIEGDALLVGGSILLSAPTSGDARLFGGTITLTKPARGDTVLMGGTVTDSGGGANVFIAGGEVMLSGGVTGAVTIFGNNVTLDGSFDGDVEVTAASHVTLLKNTIIRGELRYQAPQEATIAGEAVIHGGVHYTGTSYLPTSEEARAISLASFGVFLFVKILGALILAGLIAGLLPVFVDRVVSRATSTSARDALLTLLLGFGVLVATPILLMLLAVTFVGLGLAFILGLAYLLLIPLAFIYTAIVCGALLAQHLFKRTELRWSDAVFGMLVLFLIWALPGVGGPIALFAVLYMTGVLSHLIYRFAFPRVSLNEFEE